VEEFSAKYYKYEAIMVIINVM